MTRKIALIGASLLAALAACSEPTISPSVVTAPARSVTATPSRVGSPRKGGPVADLVARSINPADYSCSDNSAVNAWIGGKLDQTYSVELQRFYDVYFGYDAGNAPIWEAYYLQVPGASQTFGLNGQHTKTMVKAERDLKNFWAFPSSNIEVVAMHGSVLADVGRMTRLYNLVYGIPAPWAQQYAVELRGLLDSSVTMKNGNHPIFTFNAISFSPDGGAPGRIVMGDGIMQVYDELGFGDVAPQAIFAHEFAHQVQFYNNWGIAGGQPEQTRFAELNADMLAAYYLTHSHGASMNQKRVKQFLQVFYQIGDCSFADPSHHGTPNQRMAAATLGFQLADDAQKQGRVMTPAEVMSVFTANYATLIAPDAH